MDNSDAIIRELHDEARQMLEAKEEDEFIIESLMRKGQNRGYAKMILENVRSDRSKRRQFYRHLFGGIIVLFAGAALRIESYSKELPGAVFFVFNGIMISGIVAITRAIVIFRK